MTDSWRPIARPPFDPERDAAEAVEKVVDVAMAARAAGEGVTWLTPWSLAVCRLGAPGKCRWPVGFGWPHWIPRPSRLNQQCEAYEVSPGGRGGPQRACRG